ncbi:ArsR family transcriptional regulator [Paenibacillus ferrarius]|uniref:ArsR family transcriptional regulator n=1 Tax=Paenibacillus ferrarius TaxID=1469647 RepID=A0A1V4HUG4_9BACL|nr:metalloregulator ArsR/SmtB family transcription factor [Paenibacillus ferrarius]OPH62163.1 ArsR family transcriptional regulator [Paenibacillus ferrarius]
MEHIEAGSRAFKDSLYQHIAKVGKSLSSDKRLELLHLLSQGPKSVEHLAATTGSGLANISKHLQVLVESRLVKNRKQGTYIYYELASPVIAELLHALWHVAESQSADIRTLKESLSDQFQDVQTLDLNELKEKMNNGSVILIDVRPKEEFEAAHIPGAISIPLSDLEDIMSTLPLNIHIAAYCRGPYCVYAAQAARYLNEHGYQAFRVEEGVYEWQQG